MGVKDLCCMETQAFVWAKGPHTITVEAWSLSLSWQLVCAAHTIVMLSGVLSTP